MRGTYKDQKMGSENLFYRRKFYIVKNEFVEIFNAHFNENNLPAQIKHGARLIGRWMTPNDETTTEIFAIWEYDSYERYKVIEANVRNDQDHVGRVNQWYEKHGGRDYVIKNYLLVVRNGQLKTTMNK